MNETNVSLNLEETAWLYSMLLRAVMDDARQPPVESSILTPDVVAAIRSRQNELLRKLGEANDALMRRCLG
jgi:hypothetical protein